MLSDVVAEQVKKRRRALGLNREQLAEKCAANGLPLTAAAVANIESGRRGKDGRRRREVTIDELTAFALALDIAPVLLVFPVGQETVSWLLDGTVGTWDAARWFGGHGDDPIPAIGEREEVYRLPIRLYEDHDQAHRRLWVARGNAQALRRRAQTENGEVASLLRMAEENVAQTEEILRHIRQQMRERGLTPPTLGEQTAREIDGEATSR